MTLPSKAQLQYEQEVDAGKSLCGPALTDHDWTMHGEFIEHGIKHPWAMAIGCDVERMNRLFDMDDTAFAECNWCACYYTRKTAEIKD